MTLEHSQRCTGDAFFRVSFGVLKQFDQLVLNIPRLLASGHSAARFNSTEAQPLEHRVVRARVPHPTHEDQSTPHYLDLMWLGHPDEARLIVGMDELGVDELSELMACSLVDLVHEQLERGAPFRSEHVAELVQASAYLHF